MALFKLLTMSLFATVLLVHLTLKADACTCNYVSVCEDFDDADVVVRATAKSRSQPMGVYGDITYTLENTVFYKGAFRNGDEISFVTAGQSAACGTYLDVDEETVYLMGLYLSNGKYTAHICGLDETWESISDEDKASVLNGCADTLCDVDCNEFQECRFYNDHIWSEYYCADVCLPSPCVDGEECMLKQLVNCFRPPCPPTAVCN